VSTWTHPAGFTITQNLNTAQQVTQVISSMSGPTYPATLASGPGGGSNPIQYTPWGAVASLQNGCAPSGSCAAAQESYAYNNRLQMVTAQLTSGSYSSCRVYNFYVSNLTGGVPNPTGCTTTPQQGTNNNGNVGGLYYSDSGGLGHTATYQYDAVNRLWNAWATGSVAYSQTFSYDAYGNMSCSASPAEPQCLATTYNTNNNQINYITSNTVNTSYQYDPAGDLQTDGTNTYQWDAEGHLAAVYMNLNGSLVSMNTYNALGQRVEDMTPSSTTDEAYGADGSLLARYTGDSNSRSFVPFGGRLLAEYYCGGMIFDHPDEIGSATTATACTGNLVNEKLYYPFGEFWTGYALPNLGLHQEFAQLPDYDPETDQYNTANRHYSPSGRWLSPDPGGEKVVKLDDPQTWNMYAYTRNNPTSLTDPTGLCPIMYMQGSSCNELSAAAEAYDAAMDVVAGQAAQAAHANAAQNQHHHHQRPNRRPGNKAARTIYNETSGLRATAATGAGSGQDLHNARVAIAQVMGVNKSKERFAPDVIRDNLKNPDALAAWLDSLAAVVEAPTAPDGTQGATHIYLDYGDAQKKPPWYQQGEIEESFGPFEMGVKGGDVPKGEWADIEIITSPVPPQ
jgi:RHS repeat-associated protein